jgi:hypothetical protein
MSEILHPCLYLWCDSLQPLFAVINSENSKKCFRNRLKYVIALKVASRANPERGLRS